MRRYEGLTGRGLQQNKSFKSKHATKGSLKEAAKEDFRIKYTKAFPSWVFYFDTNESDAEELAARVRQLEAVCVNTSAKIHVVDVLVRFRTASGTVFLKRGHALDN